MKRYQFTEAEKQKVKEAVQAHEAKWNGEIVPFFTRQSDDYNEASWFLALILGASGVVLLALLAYSWILPSISYITSAILLIGLMVIGFVLPIFIPVLKRSLISRERAIEMVGLRAQQVFLQEKIYETKDRIGILIYVSRLEHIVLVLGDEGINAKVAPQDWENVVSAITKGLKEKNIGQGFVNGIHQCTELLMSHGFVRKDSDTNELSDELRIDGEGDK